MSKLCMTQRGDTVTDSNVQSTRILRLSRTHFSILLIGGENGNTGDDEPPIGDDGANAPLPDYEENNKVPEPMDYLPPKTCTTV